VTCHNCQTVTKRFGFTRQGCQRYRCRTCGKTFADIPPKPFEHLRVDTKDGVQVVKLLVEGVGVRAISRLTGLHQRTVLNIIEVAGYKCARLLDRKLVNLTVESVQADEVWAFVYCKNAMNFDKDPDRGDQYTFIASDRKSKLIISYTIGKRDLVTGDRFVLDLRKRIAGKFQLTTDGFTGFVRAVIANGLTVDYATQTKDYRPGYTADSNVTARRYSPGRMIASSTTVMLGNPDPAKISTSHAERLNLSIRLFNRKLTRLTLGYAKKIQNFKHCQAIVIAFFNFCRVHSAHGQTPAQAAGITDRKWTVEDLLSNTEI
jgi:transposase-like protein/IS1 family transposase